MKDTLVISGGGLLGFSALGALTILFGEFQRENFNKFIGSSVGALIAVLVSIKTPEEIYNEIKQVNIFREGNIDFLNFFEYYGFIKHDDLIQVLEKFISRTTTFAELHFKTGKHIVVVGTNLSDQCTEYFDHNMYPDMQIIDALIISISIPFIFRQVKYQNKLYTDGCVTNNFAWDYFQISSKNKLGIVLHSNYKMYKKHDILHFVHCLIHSSFFEPRNKFFKQSNNILKMDIDFPIMKEYTIDELQYLYIFGMDNAKSWLKKLK